MPTEIVFQPVVTIKSFADFKRLIVSPYATLRVIEDKTLFAEDSDIGKIYDVAHISGNRFHFTGDSRRFPHVLDKASEWTFDGNVATRSVVSMTSFDSGTGIYREVKATTVYALEFPEQTLVA